MSPLSQRLYRYGLFGRAVCSPVIGGFAVPAGPANAQPSAPGDTHRVRVPLSALAGMPEQSVSEVAA